MSLWIDASAVLPLRASAVVGGWTLLDARSVDVLRSTGATPRLSRAEAERLASAGVAHVDEVLPGAPSFDPDAAP